jgi:O-antigen/teichoic acid export membrane protein
MKRHLTNAGYGVLDYVSYPIGMLVVAPIVLHHLGAAEYGLWMVTTAVVSAGGMIASGFCDACIQRVAHLRGTGEFHIMPQTIQTMLGINSALGFALCICAWIAAPFVAPHLASSSLTPASECLTSIRIASVLIPLRAIESVFVGVQRAFERYRSTVQISTYIRLLTLGAAAVLALFGLRTPSILIATGVFLALCAWMQFRNVSKSLETGSLMPKLQSSEIPILLKRGVFVWLQTLGGVVFSQFDRILLGASLGALAVTPYSLCVQFAHPIFGLTASALNFLFPYLSGRASTIPAAALKQTLLKAFACNLILVAGTTTALLIFGDFLIRIWAGPDVAQSAAQILPPIVLGSALMGLSVTGTYAMQALGLFRTVAYISLAGRTVMLLLMVDMMRNHGLHGLALSRLAYGSVSLLVYLPLVQRLNIERGERKSAAPLKIPCQAEGGLKP